MWKWGALGVLTAVLGAGPIGAEESTLDLVGSWNVGGETLRIDEHNGTALSGAYRSSVEDSWIPAKGAADNGLVSVVVSLGTGRDEYIAGLVRDAGRGLEILVLSRWSIDKSGRATDLPVETPTAFVRK